MPTLLTLDTAISGAGKLVLVAVGEIDLSNIDEFNQALAASTAEAAARGGKFTVDLSAVEYLDSAAINALFAHADDIDLIAQPLLMSALTMSGLAELVSIEVAPSGE
ncbi:anti-anti-sigma factor [Mycobacterium intermedium]|uniref:Anti-anti-sigma factor n=1 Tax=Mycobacterium intermedium TaxID=28445 RepID=A0A1E3SF94_MYCIE|nr:STAS domain-containing protein [Mycobacterium intermedium]MCV6966666.1 STAS domain-containing protein [Mycobacterium intermedium]ODR00817.1 anti-anti-sigma factor [Mycobacterium intermedium]OPE52136.1 anti-anti-sigma factor [Mycobacterium intermedium]ORB10576.1 anti-anti-sigma factor [Mycobacterium intermedium]